MGITKKAAEILVECGHADAFRKPVNPKYSGLLLTRKSKNPDPEIEDDSEWCDPFADTLEGRRQAHAIINYIIKNNFSVWAQSAYLEKDMTNFDIFEFSGRRIKWCLEELSSKQPHNPSCFKKQLGVEACTHGCPVSDECYAGGNDND